MSENENAYDLLRKYGFTKVKDISVKLGFIPVQSIWLSPSGQEMSFGDALQLASDNLKYENAGRNQQ